MENYIAKKYLDKRTNQPVRLDNLDAADNVFFLRQLTAIENKFYATKHAPRQGRQLVPTFSEGLGPWTESYGYRMVDFLGKAKRTASHSEDVPLVNARGNETFQRFQMYTLGFEYTIDEIVAAAKLGVPLESMRSTQVKTGLDQQLDDIVAEGDSVAGLSGFGNITGANSFTLTTKVAGGTRWLTTGGATNATPDEIIRDLNQMITKVHVDTHEAEDINRIVLPTMLFEHITNTPRASVSDTTIKKFFEETHPGVTFAKWERLNDLSGHNNRIIGYDYNVDATCLLMAVEFEMQAPERRNFAYYIPCRIKTGGVISRYPKSIIYADGAVA